MASDKLTRGEWFLIFWLWASGLMAGYGICLGVNLHDAGENYRRGREQGWNDQVALPSTCPGINPNLPTDYGNQPK